MVDTVSSLISELNNFEIGGLEYYINAGGCEEELLEFVLRKSICRPEIIQIRDKNRVERDAFFKKLTDLTSNKFPKLNELISLKYQVIVKSEEIFDRISRCIGKCDISKQPSDVQIWSHLKRVEKDFSDLQGYIEDVLKDKPKDAALSPYFLIKNNNGQEFSADGASENLVKYISITIKLLAYKYSWISNGNIVIPSEAHVTDDNIYQAGSIELLARSWLDLEDICQRTLVFGGAVYEENGDDVPSDVRDSGFKTSYHFDRGESPYEFHDAVACERVKRKSLQNYMEIISNKDIRGAVKFNDVGVSRVQDGNFLCEEEILTCSVLGDIFCVDTLEDTKDYHGLTLAEWIRSYFILQYISKKINNKEIGCYLEEIEIIAIFERFGVSKGECLKFIDLASFSKDSADLYDCPLIKVEDGRLYIAYYICLNFGVSNIILSRFSSLEVNASDKGPRFESYVVDLIYRNVGNCKTFKFKRDDNEYQYDAVFILDRKIFVLECKNRSLAWYNPIKAYRNEKYLYESVQQVVRLKNALINYPEVIQEHFGVDCSNFEIIPVILNCMPFSWRGDVNGVYVSDFSSFARLFRSSEIFFVSSSINGQSSRASSYKQWKGSKICSGDLINHFKNPIQVLPYIKSRKPNYRWWVADEDLAFTVKVFEVDPINYQKQESKIFSFGDKNSKNKRVSKLKSMKKKSRRINRRK